MSLAELAIIVALVLLLATVATGVCLGATYRPLSRAPQLTYEQAALVDARERYASGELDLAELEQHIELALGAVPQLPPIAAGELRTLAAWREAELRISDQPRPSSYVWRGQQREVERRRFTGDFRRDLDLPKRPTSSAKKLRRRRRD